MSYINLTFLQTHSTGGDCTAPYDVTYYKDFTFRELLKAIKARGEYGLIKVYDPEADPPSYISAMYDMHGTDKWLGDYTFPEEWMDLIVEQPVSAAGGWGLMDYVVRLKSEKLKDDIQINEEKPKESGTAQIQFMPVCSYCGVVIRPPVHFKPDFDFGEWKNDKEFIRIPTHYELTPDACPHCRRIFTSIIMATSLPFQGYEEKERE